MKNFKALLSTPKGKFALLGMYLTMLLLWYLDFKSPTTEILIRAGFYQGVFADVLLLGIALGLGGGFVAAWTLPKRTG